MKYSTYTILTVFAVALPLTLAQDDLIRVSGKIFCATFDPSDINPNAPAAPTPVAQEPVSAVQPAAENVNEVETDDDNEWNHVPITYTVEAATTSRRVLRSIRNRRAVSNPDQSETVAAEPNGDFNVIANASSIIAVQPLFVQHVCPSIFPDFQNCKFTIRIDIPFQDPNQPDALPVDATLSDIQCL